MTATKYTHLIAERYRYDRGMVRAACGARRVGIMSATENPDNVTCPKCAVAAVIASTATPTA